MNKYLREYTKEKTVVSIFFDKDVYFYRNNYNLIILVLRK